MDSEISIKAPKCRDKFLGRIYLYSICEQESGVMQTPGNLSEKPTGEKSQ